MLLWHLTVLREACRCLFSFFHWYSEGVSLLLLLLLRFRVVVASYGTPRGVSFLLFCFFIGTPRGVSLLFLFFHITLWLLLPSCCCYVFVVDVASYSTPRCVSLLFSCFFKGTCPNVVHGTCPNSSTGSLVHMGQARTSCGLFLWKGFLMAAINLTLCSTTAPSLVDDLCAFP